MVRKALRVRYRLQSILPRCTTLMVEELPLFPASVGEVIEEKVAANHFFENVITRAKAQAQAQGVKLTTHMVSGHAVKTIVEFVEREHADLLVIGFMGTQRCTIG